MWLACKTGEVRRSTLAQILSARLCRYPIAVTAFEHNSGQHGVKLKKEVAAAFQVLSDLPGEGSTFRNLNPVASWMLTHLTFEPLATRTLWHDFLPPSAPLCQPCQLSGLPEKMSDNMSDRIEHSCRTSLGRLVISMSVGRMVAGV